MLKRVVSSPLSEQKLPSGHQVATDAGGQPFQDILLKSTECFVSPPRRCGPLRGVLLHQTVRVENGEKPKPLCVNRDQPNGSKVLPVCPLLPGMTTRTLQHRTPKFVSNIKLCPPEWRLLERSLTPPSSHQVAAKKGGNVVFFKGDKQGHSRWRSGILSGCYLLYNQHTKPGGK